MNIKKCFIICWFGKLPSYVDVWAKSCATNQDFDFLIFTDATVDNNFPPNVKVIPFTMEKFVNRAKSVFNCDVNIKRPYRLCDFKPTYGEIFSEELKEYDFWGHCDIDLIFGNLKEFITDDMLKEKDLIYNAGHLTLYRNSEEINKLYLKKGSAFDFSTVSTKDATFAFDEETGMKRIARQNGVKAAFGLPYIDAEIGYHQLRSRLERTNPDWQAYYWEQGNLYRVKLENGQVSYQKQAYIHLQKRKIEVSLAGGNIGEPFWITPTGYENKKYLGKPTPEDVKRTNPYEGEKALRRQNLSYKFKKIIAIMKRSPYQIYVRVVQARYGINQVDGSLEERPWEKY